MVFMLMFSDTMRGASPWPRRSPRRAPSRPARAPAISSGSTFSRPASGAIGFDRGGEQDRGAVRELKRLVGRRQPGSGLPERSCLLAALERDRDGFAGARGPRAGEDRDPCAFEMPKRRRRFDVDRLAGPPWRTGAFAADERPERLVREEGLPAGEHRPHVAAGVRGGDRRSSRSPRRSGPCRARRGTGACRLAWPRDRRRRTPAR